MALKKCRHLDKQLHFREIRANRNTAYGTSLQELERLSRVKYRPKARNTQTEGYKCVA